MNISVYASLIFISTPWAGYNNVTCVSMNSVQFMEKTMKSEFKGRGRVGLNRETTGRLEKGGGAGTLGNTCTQPSTPTSALSVFKNKPKTHSVSI